MTTKKKVKSQKKAVQVKKTAKKLAPSSSVDQIKLANSIKSLETQLKNRNTKIRQLYKQLATFSDEIKLSVEDSVLSMVPIPNPVFIQVRVTSTSVFLQVGNRDYEWDISTKELVHTGTLLTEEGVEDSEINATEVPLENTAGEDEEEFDSATQAEGDGNV